MSDLGGTASRSTARTACMRQRRRASRSSAHRASTWAPFPYRGIPTTWPSRVRTRRRCTSSLAEQCTRSRCSQKGIRAGRNSLDLALPGDDPSARGPLTGCVRLVTFTTIAFDDSSLRWLEMVPDHRTQRALFHLSYSCASSVLRTMLVTHDPLQTLDWRHEIS